MEKDPDSEKDRRQEEEGDRWRMTWLRPNHEKGQIQRMTWLDGIRQLNGPKFEQVSEMVNYRQGIWCAGVDGISGFGHD